MEHEQNQCRAFRQVKALVRQVAIACGALLLSPGLTHAADNIQLDGLRTPSSPAFVLLGVEPATVERPSTPKALAASLVSAARDSDSLIPRNYAVEVAPYWLTVHPDLTFDQYYNPNILHSILQTLSVSAATSVQDKPTSGSPATADTTTTGNATGVGIGVRTLLVSGKANPDLTKAKEAYDKKNRELLVSDLKDEEVSAQLKPLALAVAGLDKKRVGFTVDAASAASWRFPKDKFNDGQFDRFGFWITPSYKSERVDYPFEVLAVARYIRDDGNLRANIADIGGRLGYEWGDFALSLEGVERFQSGGNSGGNTERYGGIAEYKLLEGTYLSATVGKDFNSANKDQRTLIALFGINVGLGKSPSINLK